MAKWNRKICPRCRKIFVAEKEDQEFCQTICADRWHGRKLPGETIKHLSCKTCGVQFEALYRRKYCTHACAAHGYAYEGDSSHKKKIKEANKKWLNQDIEKNKKPRKKRLSFEEIIRRNEYNRVYGKGAWEHYEKGRKWDRI